MRCAPAPAFARRLAAVLVWLLAAAPVAAATVPAQDWLFLDNGEIRLGVLKSSGAGIAWFSASGSATNLVNHYDRGRLIQQSYYGDPDGSLWNRQPWRWNPVQGGDWQGRPATVLELKSGTNWLTSRSVARHWASGVELTNVLFEQSIGLTGRVAHVRFQMTYTGTNSHAPHDHEIPAVFVPPQFDRLVLYQGPAPWTGGELHRSRPGWPNESRKPTEPWAAFVNADDFGLGVYVPVAERLTCYRFGRESGDPSACSYFAPLIRFAITPGKVFRYDAYLSLGQVNELRARFQQLHERTRPDQSGRAR